VEEREEFLTYPQTSPQIYAWLPYHRKKRTTQTPAAPADGNAPSRVATVESAGGIEPATGDET
jgi:hypothetical protein